MQDPTKVFKALCEAFGCSSVSNNGYRSIMQPSMRPDPASRPAGPGHTDSVMPDPLFRGHVCLTWVYSLAQSPAADHYFPNGIVLMSLEQAKDMHRAKAARGQTRVFDFAYRYIGMGHVTVYFADLDSADKIYSRPDGGANGWERMHNFEAACAWSGEEEAEGAGGAESLLAIFCAQP